MARSGAQRGAGGARRLILFNSHGGQISLVDIVCRDIRIEPGTLAVGCSWFRIAEVGDLFSAHEIEHGVHGGDIETSMMLAVDPAHVEMSRAADFVPLTVAIRQSGSVLTAEGRVGLGWQAQDLHPAGVCGDAGAATADKCRVVIERAAEGLVRLIGAFRLAGNQIWARQMGVEAARRAGDRALAGRLACAGELHHGPQPARPELLAAAADITHYFDRLADDPAYWARVSPAARLEGVALDVPTLHVGGWRDLCLRGRSPRTTPSPTASSSSGRGRIFPGDGGWARSMRARRRGTGSTARSSRSSPIG